MRFTFVLLFISSAIFACRVAATASNHPKPRGNSVRHTLAIQKLRQAEEEERLPPSPDDLLQKLRSMVKNTNLPSKSAGGAQAFHRGLSILHQKLMAEFGSNKELDNVLALAFKHLVNEEDKPIRDHLYSIQAGREVIGDDQLQKMLLDLSDPFDPQVVLDKLKPLVGDPALPLISIPRQEMLENPPGPYFEEVLVLDQKLKKMFPTEEAYNGMKQVAKEHVREDGTVEPILIHVNNLMELKTRWGTAFEETMKAYAKQGGTIID